MISLPYFIAIMALVVEFVGVVAAKIFKQSLGMVIFFQFFVFAIFILLSVQMVS